MIKRDGGFETGFKKTQNMSHLTRMYKVIQIFKISGSKYSYTCKGSKFRSDKVIGLDLIKFIDLDLIKFIGLDYGTNENESLWMFELRSAKVYYNK